MTLPIQTLLPIHVVHVSLRFHEQTYLKSLHSPSLSAFIRYLADSPARFDELIKIDAPESGRCEYSIGDAYHFTLYGLNGSQDILAYLLHALQKLPFSAVKQDKKIPFRNNLTLDSLHDAFSGLPIKHITQLTPYTLYDLQRDCQQWQGVNYFRLQLLSPIRLLKTKTARGDSKGEARYCQQLSDLSGDLLSNRLHDYFAELIKKQGINLAARNQPVPLTLLPNSHVFWLNASYSDSEGKAHVMGGMMGELFISIPDPEQFDWSLWLLGQYTGFGQRSAFGFGRYVLENAAGEQQLERVSSSHSLLTSIGSSENLITALEHIQNNREPIEEPSEEDDEILLERLAIDIDKLLQQNFTPPPLQGFLIENADDSPRPLAVPPFRDRVLQRAVAQILQPIVDDLHYEHSYGYRVGRSRINACYAIQAAWREGYQWVYESDIADFFDSVLWQRLTVRLQGLWNDEPLIHALMQWMQAPVAYQGQLIQRSQGLPQGSPLSPLLANIMLDDFDNDMQLAGFRLVRFADDFVVLCKTKEQAEQAHLTAVASLQEHGLTLNADKTHISNMADGFYYLGYLFVNDLALESPKRLRKQNADKSISKLSWFSQVIVREPNTINNIKTCEVFKTSQVSTNLTPQAETTKMTASPLEDWQSSSDETAQQYGERDQQGLLLCITGDSCVLRTQEQHLQVERAQQNLYHIPWQQLHAVLLLGNHHITTPALQDAMQHNIPLHFASQTGKYQGVVWNGQAGAKGTALWLRQQQIFAHPHYALTLSQEIVSARLSNCAETLRLRNKTEAQQHINALIDKLPAAKTLAELNGLEGMGTRYYFAALKELLPEQFGFNERNRQPPLDPFNALLSLGFSLLYSCLESVLRTDGLLPWQGFYHQPHGKHATLASDLIEPFRHLVERLALSLINRKQLKFNDFYITDQQACYLQKEARNFYLSQLMAKLEEKNAFELMHQQNLSLINFIEQGENFKAWRVR